MNEEMIKYAAALLEREFGPDWQCIAQELGTENLRKRVGKDLTSFMAFPERGSGGNSQWRGNCSPEVVSSILRYAKQTALCGIRIHRDHLDEAVSIVNKTVARSGILKQLSRAAFSHQDITEFESLALTLRQKILTDLEPFYAKHLGLYITQECLENPGVPPLIYCRVNHCVCTKMGAAPATGKMLRNAPLQNT